MFLFNGDRLSFVTSKIIFNFHRYFMELNVRKQSPYRFNLSYQVASYSKSSLAIARKKNKEVYRCKHSLVQTPIATQEIVDAVYVTHDATMF